VNAGGISRQICGGFPALAHRPGSWRMRRAGFSLVEVLAALTVLSVMVMLLGRLFNDSSTAWTTGTRRAALDSSARATLDFLSYEIGQAIVDDLIPLVVETNKTENALGVESDVIRLVSLSNKAEQRSGTTYRDSQALVYFVNTTITNETAGLWRRVSEKFTSGVPLAQAYAGDPAWLSSPLTTIGYDANVISPEVIRLKASVTTTNIITHTDGYDSHKHGLPMWLDLYLELMTEQDVMRAALLSESERADYIRQKARRYSGRIYLQNRQQPVTY